MTWNDPNNWQHFGPFADLAAADGRRLPIPTSSSHPSASLPKGSSTTINFNFTYLYMPLNSLTIEDSYTFTGTPIQIDQSAVGVESLHARRPTGPTRRSSWPA